jgi:hypothetical protein
MCKREEIAIGIALQTDAHELTDLLSNTIGSAPLRCPGCMAAQDAVGKQVQIREPALV